MESMEYGEYYSYRKLEVDGMKLLRIATFNVLHDP